MRVLGEVSGADNYILRDVPAAGQARRLRARAIRVHAYAHLIAREAARRTGLAIVSETSGSFALEGDANEDAERNLSAYQAEIDQWALAELRGELVVHLAVESKMDQRRGRPLEGALVAGARWNTAAFSTGWSDPDAIQCPACGATASNSGDGVCMTCAEDDAGASLALPHSKVLGNIDEAEWPASVRQMPSADFAGLARRSPGSRKLLGYLAVSALPDGADCGDTLVLGNLMIGAWDVVLRVALALRDKVEGDFAAGVVLADPRSSMRAAAASARQQLARAGANSCSLFGELLDWKRAAEVAERGFEMAGWLKEDRISGTDSRRRAIRRIAELHRMSRVGENGWQLRYIPLLIWEARDVDKVLRRRIMRLAADREQWETTGLVTELAFLAAPARAEGKGSIHG